FFFQAEDGIRAFHVTGVQTCALPIFKGNHDRFADERWKQLGIQEIHQNWRLDSICFMHHAFPTADVYTISGHVHPGIHVRMPTRSEERRVGIEARRWCATARSSRESQ